MAGLLVTEEWDIGKAWAIEGGWPTDDGWWPSSSRDGCDSLLSQVLPRDAGRGAEVFIIDSLGGVILDRPDEGPLPVGELGPVTGFTEGRWGVGGEAGI